MQSFPQRAAVAMDCLDEFEAYRAVQNARRRWIYSLLVLALVALYQGVYFLTNRVHFDGEIATDEYYPVAFTWLGLVALLGALAGTRARPRWANDTWIALLLSAMAALAVLDGMGLQVTAYVLIAVPAATLHSTSPRRAILLHGAATLAVVVGVLQLAPQVDIARMVWFVTLGVCFVSALYVGVYVEKARRDEFRARHALAVANAELEQHSRLLAHSNTQLEAGNQALAERSEELARANTELLARGRALEEANRRLEQLAMTDPLTGVANRRLFFEMLDREFSRARRYGHPLAVAVLDLDDFGLINKQHGMIVGDEVLGRFALVLSDHVRSADIVGRYGGEEFVVLMPDSGLHAAEQLIERLRERVAATPFGSRALPLSFSAGVTVLLAEDSDPLEVIKRGDEAMRRAKHAGKNRVLCA